MKIMQIMPEFGLAGAEIMCENLTYELLKAGHDVIVVSMFDFHSAITERMEKNGIDIRYLDKKPGLDISIIPKMIKLFKNEKPNVIHTHRYVMQYAIPAAIMVGIKQRVHTVHNIASKENGFLARKLNKIFFKYFHVIPVALSELIRDSIVSEYRIKDECIPVIFNGIDLSKCISKDNYEFRGNFKILHVGRFSDQKNHKGLLDAFELLRRKSAEVELWLIGNGEKRKEVESYVQEHHLTECVKFFGVQSNVYGYMHDADAFVLPSNYEGIPMTLIEAMGTGLPIVATMVGGIPDMLEDKVNALLVENSSQKIADALYQLLMEKYLRETYGMKAKDRSMVFSSVQMANSYIKTYESGRI